MSSTINEAFELLPKLFALMEYNCPRMTAPTTSNTPTMMTERTVLVSWFANPRLCFVSILVYFTSGP